MPDILDVNLDSGAELLRDLQNGGSRALEPVIESIQGLFLRKL